MDVPERLYRIRELATAGLDISIDVSEADIEYLMELFSEIWDLADLEDLDA